MVSGGGRQGVAGAAVRGVSLRSQGQHWGLGCHWGLLACPPPRGGWGVSELRAGAPGGSTQEAQAGPRCHSAYAVGGQVTEVSPDSRSHQLDSRLPWEEEQKGATAVLFELWGVPVRLPRRTNHTGRPSSGVTRPAWLLSSSPFLSSEYRPGFRESSVLSAGGRPQHPRPRRHRLGTSAAPPACRFPSFWLHFSGRLDGFRDLRVLTFCLSARIPP